MTSNMKQCGLYTSNLSNKSHTEHGPRLCQQRKSNSPSTRVPDPHALVPPVGQVGLVLRQVAAAPADEQVRQHQQRPANDHHDQQGDEQRPDRAVLSAVAVLPNKTMAEQQTSGSARMNYEGQATRLSRQSKRTMEGSAATTLVELPRSVHEKKMTTALLMLVSACPKQRISHATGSKR